MESNPERRTASRLRILTLGVAGAASAMVVGGLLYAAATFLPDSQPTGWVAGPRLSSPDLSETSGVMFRPYYDRVNWAGNLFAFPVDTDGNIDWQNQLWKKVNKEGAAALLDAMDWDKGRKIVTLKSDGSKIPFRWGPVGTGYGNAPGAKPTTQSAVLGDKVTGQGVLNYLRGDRSGEATDTYRARISVLGDIVHSQPVYVPYDSVGKNTVGRVFVGANDGMLHAFDASSGDEVFAYIPSMILPRLVTLTEEPYTHIYTVDGSPAARKVTLGGNAKIILVGGIGAGGSGAGTSGVDGLYALDVTDPDAASETAAASKILWEITPSTRAVGGTIQNAPEYANLGQVYGAPLIVKVKTNGGTWAAIVGNGYNSGKGNSSLLVIDLATGALIKELVADNGGGSSNPGGLSKPAAVDTDGDGVVDLVYAGDINGKMFRFDLSDATAGNWTSGLVYDAKLAITGAPTLKFHPLGGTMINFGTGRMFTSADATDKTTAYAVYGIRDDQKKTINDSDLVTQTLTEQSYVGCAIGNCRVRVTSNTPVDLLSKKGWKLQLPAGERVVGDGGFINTQNRFAFTSTNPTVDNASLATAGTVAPSGENWLMEVQYDTGGTDNLTPFLDMNGDKAVNAADLVGTSGGAGSRVPMGRLISFGVASQPILAQLSSNSRSFVNTNTDYSLTFSDTGNCSGVCNGHFDWDIYYGQCDYAYDGNGVATSWNGCNTHNHTHQYDDKYNVTGVNMLKPSNPTSTLSNAIPGNQGFKILIAGQKLSPSISIVMSDVDNSPDYIQAITYATSSPVDLSLLPTWSLNGSGTSSKKLATFTVNLPKNAFSTRLWEQMGVPQCTPAAGTECRVGVIPNQTGCVTSNSNNGEPEMVGAFTIQIVKDNVAPGDVELNVASQPLMGWRLKHNKLAQGKLLAMYTLFWHASGAGCYGDAGYVANPPPVPETAPGVPPAGSGDPVAGTNIGGNPKGSTQQVVQLINFITGGNLTTTITPSATGPSKINATVKDPGGSNKAATAGSGGGGDGPKEKSTQLFTGRLSWREVVRP